MKSQEAIELSASAWMQENARDVANALLSRTGLALMRNDVEDFSKCFHLPYKIETFEGSKTLSTIQDFHETFQNMRKHLVRKSVTEMIRNCLSAEFDDEDTIHSTHDTRLMNGARLVQEPFPCFSVLRRHDGMWKIERSSYAIVHEPQHVAALLGPEFSAGR